MDSLKKLWPTPFKIKEKDIGSFIVQLIIFALICIVGGLLIGFLAHLPVIQIFAGIFGALLDIYGLVGIVLCILVFVGVVK